MLSYAMETQSFKLSVNYIKKVAFLSYNRIKPFKLYAPLAQLVEQLVLNHCVPVRIHEVVL